MKIEFEGRTWDYEPDRLDVKQATVLYMTYGLTIKAWSNGFPELDQRCYHFAYWHMLQQAGEKKPIADCNPNIIDFISVYVEAQTAETEEARAREEAEKAEDPTPSSPQGEAPSREPSPRRRRPVPVEPTGS